MKNLKLFVSLFMLFGFAFLLVGCGDNSTTTTTTNGGNDSTTTTTEATLSPYFVAGSFNGYIADDEGSRMQALAEEEGWYTFTVELNADNRDNAYDGHYYTITDGTWTTTFGTTSYALQPAPTSPTGGGMGSIYVYENQTLTILFDSNTNTVYDSSMVKVLDNPIIYGDFNTAMDHGADWSIALTDALVLEDTDSNGIYEGEWTFPAYTGSSESGYTLLVATATAYYIGAWGHSWGVLTQYLFDGNLASMGAVNNLKPTVDTTYHFAYDSATHITTCTVVE